MNGNPDDVWTEFGATHNGPQVNGTHHQTMAAAQVTSEGEQRAPAVRPGRAYAPDRVWDRFGTRVQEKIEPATVQNQLEAAEAGDPEAAHQVFNTMELTWDRLMKDIHELRTAASRQVWEIEAFSEKDEAPSNSALEKARLVEDVLKSMRGNVAEGKNGTRDMLYDIADAVGKGLSVQEIDWQFKDGTWVPANTRWVDPRYYGLNPRGTHLGLRNQQGGGSVDWQPFPRDKFMVAGFKNRSGNMMGYGLFRALAWWWAAGIYSRDWLVRYAELFGLPFRVARHDPGADDDEKLMILKGLEEMGAAGVAVVPVGTEIELLESTKSAGENPQAVLLDRRDRSADILILGQTLTTDVGDSGSRALGEVHEAVRMSRLVEVTEWTADVVNSSIVPAILRLNYGNTDECPKMRLQVPEGGTPLEKIQRDEIFTRIAPIGKNAFYAAHGVPVPDPKEETVMQLAPSAPPFAATGAGGWPRQPIEATDAGIPGEEDPLLDKAIENIAGVNARWLAPVKKRVMAVFAMAASDKVSEEQFQTELAKLISDVPALFDNVDREALAKEMEALQGAAMINGAAARLEATPGAAEALGE